MWLSWGKQNICALVITKQTVYRLPTIDPIVYMGEVFKAGYVVLNAQKSW